MKFILFIGLSFLTGSILGVLLMSFMQYKRIAYYEREIADLKKKIFLLELSEEK